MNNSSNSTARSSISAGLIVIATGLQHAPAEKFEAPKARLARLLFEGFFHGSPVVGSIAVALGVVIVFGFPILLAWDFAKGERRRTWVWVTLAALSSWLVLVAFWIASSRASDSEDGNGRRTT